MEKGTNVAHRSSVYHVCTLGLGPGPMGPALMVVFRVAHRSSIHHSCTLGLGPGPRRFWCVHRMLLFVFVKLSALLAMALSPPEHFLPVQICKIYKTDFIQDPVQPEPSGKVFENMD